MHEGIPIYEYFEMFCGLFLYACKYPNAQITSTGNGRPISSTGTITGSEKSHFWYCDDLSFFLFYGLDVCSVTEESR